MKKNFWLDVILFLSALICIVTGILMDFRLISGGREVRFLIRNLHIYSGYVMGIGIIFHIFWHGAWIKNATKNIFVKKN